MEAVRNSDNHRPEPRSYAAYFNNLRNAGHEIRVALSLRSTESAAPYQFQSVVLPPDPFCQEWAFHNLLTATAEAAHLRVSPSPEKRSAPPIDFVSWFSDRHGALSLAYHARPTSAGRRGVYWHGRGFYEQTQSQSMSHHADNLSVASLYSYYEREAIASLRVRERSAPCEIRFCA